MPFNKGLDCKALGRLTRWYGAMPAPCSAAVEIGESELLIEQSWGASNSATQATVDKS